ncbi:hypothetical protein HQQ82_05385 [Rathayibacter sp. VKM Ac-2856]|uniref:hypothetical protein n=1 Tax=unclassified Rathayibacter TaxID=2609250 RepID=UPI0015658CB4|nr:MULTISPECIES: hypothetical protein [unclassified Rathayibacter]NQX04231.1 hypothetical protein [Rathayibacter sp. VKM Ac-2858]NQX19400.1 hypothetical protein [Rathayibacter sp. VKM Ac-2856]
MDAGVTRQGRAICPILVLMILEGLHPGGLEEVAACSPRKTFAIRIARRERSIGLAAPAPLPVRHRCRSSMRPLPPRTADEDVVTRAALVGGLAAGLLLGRGRAPRRRAGSLVAGVALLAVIIGAVALHASALGDAVLARAAAILGSTAYAATVWSSLIPDPEVSWFGWAWRELLRPRYVRAQFERVGDE